MFPKLQWILDFAGWNRIIYSLLLDFRKPKSRKKREGGKREEKRKKYELIQQSRSTTEAKWDHRCQENTEMNRKEIEEEIHFIFSNFNKGPLKNITDHTSKICVQFSLGRVYGISLCQDLKNMIKKSNQCWLKYTIVHGQQN